MICPDSRLLVKVSVLPFVPVGTMVWRYNGTAWVVICHDDRGLLVCRADATGEVRWCNADATMLLDLSKPAQVLLKPAKVDVLGARLDALDFALSVLAKRLGWTGDANAFWWSDNRMAGFADDVNSSVDMSDPPWWPDLTGLSPGDASRAVVVAALQARSIP